MKYKVKNYRARVRTAGVRTAADPRRALADWSPDRLGRSAVAIQGVPGLRSAGARGWRAAAPRFPGLADGGWNDRTGRAHG